MEQLPIKIKLPKDFLNEEIRCEYTVTAKMKAVWAIELDLLAELDRVCKKYNIKYFADGGTILGAVRHKGFIPWDDDIDIAMLREDYEKLSQIAENEFKHPYFFQTEYTDRGCLLGHAQLKNVLTTCIVPAFPRKVVQGIFIDIFPLDAVPDDKEIFKKQKDDIEKTKHVMWELASITDYYSKERKTIANTLKGFLHYFSPLINKIYDYQKLFKKYELLCAKYDSEKTQQISLLSFQPTWDRLIRRRCDYQEFVDMEFEFTKIPVIKFYDDTLTRLYGDYHKLVKGTAAHEGCLSIVDPYKPYKEYLEEQSV